MNVAVKPFPDLKNDTLRERLMKMVQELENIPKFGQGESGTELWIREYEQVD